MNQVAERLQEFRDLVKDVVASACRTRLFEAGFVPDDFLHPTDMTSGTNFSFTFSRASHLFYFSFLDGLNGAAFTMPDSMDIDTLAQPPDKATYAEQANKRAQCRRLTK